METLNHKIDFSVIITVNNANPNGDPLSGNRPRENYEGYGEISDVCIKRKIRNRLQDMGEKIFVQSDDRCNDGFKSLKERAENNEAIKAISNGKNTDFFYIEKENPEEAVKEIVRLVKNNLPRYYKTPWNHIQVLTPMQKGIVGAANLNLALQEALFNFLVR